MDGLQESSDKSEFGKFMDALSDKVLTMGMFVVYLHWGPRKWTLFLILLILSREFLITDYDGSLCQGKTLQLEKLAIKTVVQLVCISFLGQLAMEVGGRSFSGLNNQFTSD